MKPWEMMRRFGATPSGGGGGAGAGILAKLTCFWPFESASDGVMASTQPDVVSGVANAGLNYGAAPAAGAGRGAGRFAPVLSGQAYVSANGAFVPAISPGVGDFCMFGWVKITAYPGNYIGIATRYNAGDSGTSASVGLRFFAGGAVHGWFSNGSADKGSVVPAGSFPLNQWALVMFQRRANVIQTNINNALFGPALDVTGVSPNQGNPIWFGSSGNYFKLSGQIQDFGWIKGASLTDEEMEWLYNGGAGRTYADIVAAAS
jgi:hypothetical protein